MTELGKPDEIKCHLLHRMKRYDSSIIIQLRDDVRYTPLPSERVFEFSEVEKYGMMYDSEEEEKKQEEKKQEEKKQEEKKQEEKKQEEKKQEEKKQEEKKQEEKKQEEKKQEEKKQEEKKQEEKKQEEKKQEEKKQEEKKQEEKKQEEKKQEEKKQEEKKQEEKKQEEEDASQTYLDIPLPYWRIYREGKGFLAVYKTQQKKMETADKYNVEWLNDPYAGDIFLALGWLVEQAGGKRQITRYVCALNLSTNPVSMWLNYDYRQPDYCYDFLRTAAIPTFPDRNYYLDCIVSCVPAEETGPSQQAKQNEEKNLGVMGQSEPWDIACLYWDADHDWPESLSDAAVVHQASASLQVFGNAKNDLRAKRTEPPAGLLARLAHAS